jgi:hypothetical protein
MKKLIFTVVVAICFSTGVMAQGISGGIKAGLNFANQKYDAGSFSASPDARTSFHAGVFAIIKMEHWACSLKFCTTVWDPSSMMKCQKLITFPFLF